MTKHSERICEFAVTGQAHVDLIHNNYVPNIVNTCLNGETWNFKMLTDYEMYRRS